MPPSSLHTIPWPMAELFAWMTDTGPALDLVHEFVRLHQETSEGMEGRPVAASRRWCRHRVDGSLEPHNVTGPLASAASRCPATAVVQSALVWLGARRTRH